ncbi:MAG: hypothetical protein KBT04_04645 [Bacteroidales bacterium]|nr:hypothetical protein [Candidatus Colimorpha onthohippi]
MKRLYFTLLACSACICCTQHNTDIQQDDSTEICDTSASIGYNETEWAPKEFKMRHCEEWLVVNKAINLEQRNAPKPVDFAKIDTLVKDYITLKKISLPTDICQQIKVIEEICKTKFDFSDYDYSNFGMRIAEGTKHLFEGYIHWLYEKEANRVLEEAKWIDLDKELSLYQAMNTTLYNVCDSVAQCMDGSGGWIANSEISEPFSKFKTAMFIAILGSKPELTEGMDVPLSLFDKECKKLTDFYDSYHKRYGCMMQVKNPHLVVNRYKNAFHTWYAYRKATASKIKDAKLKEVYESITYSHARMHLLRLKNRYSDFGMVSSSMMELCLTDSCSNEELLNFDYEKKFEEYLKH